MTSGPQGCRWVFARAGCVHSLALPGHLVALGLLVGMLDCPGALPAAQGTPSSLCPSALDCLVQRAASKAAFPHHPRALQGTDGLDGRSRGSANLINQVPKPKAGRLPPPALLLLRAAPCQPSHPGAAGGGMRPRASPLRPPGKCHPLGAPALSLFSRSQCTL